MAQEFWTDYPQQPWWKLFAPRWLNSRTYNAMPYQARGPYDCICFQLMCEENPPGVIAYSDEVLSDFAKLTIDEWRLERFNILMGFWLYPDGTIHHRTIKALWEQRCREAHENYVNGEKGAYAKKLKALPPRSKTKIPEPKILEYRSPYFKWEHLEGKRADKAVREGGLEGGLWGASDRVLDPATRGADHPLTPIEKRERRVDKTLLSDQATTPAAGEAGGGVAVAEPPVETGASLVCKTIKSEKRQ